MYRTLENWGSLNPVYTVMCTKTRLALHCWPNTLPSLFDVGSIQQTRTRIKTCTCYVCASDNFSSFKNLIFKRRSTLPRTFRKIQRRSFVFLPVKIFTSKLPKVMLFFFNFAKTSCSENSKRSAQQLRFLPLFKWWLLYELLVDKFTYIWSGMIV